MISDQLPEQELIEFLEDVNRLVLRHWDHLVATPHDALPEALRRLVGANRARRPSLDHQTGISGDVAT